MQPDSQADILTSADLEVYQETKYQDSEECLMARDGVDDRTQKPRRPDMWPLRSMVQLHIRLKIVVDFETLQHSCRVRIDLRTESFATETFNTYTRLRTTDRDATIRQGAVSVWQDWLKQCYKRVWDIMEKQKMCKRAASPAWEATRCRHARCKRRAGTTDLKVVRTRYVK